MSNIANEICLAAIFNINGAKRICVGIWWSGDDLTRIDLYDPAADVINECSPKEFEEYFNKGLISLHSPPKGRLLNPPKSRWK